MLLGIILIGLLLLVLAGSGRHLLGCAWHLFLAVVVLVIVVGVVLVFVAHRAGYT